MPKAACWRHPNPRRVGQDCTRAGTRCRRPANAPSPRPCRRSSTGTRQFVPLTDDTSPPASPPHPGQRGLERRSDRSRTGAHPPSSGLAAHARGRPSLSRRRSAARVEPRARLPVACCSPGAGHPRVKAWGYKLSSLIVGSGDAR